VKNKLNRVEEPTPQGWGGNWTDIKNDIVVDYAKAYLMVMKDRRYWPLLYFDGFAGEGVVINDDAIDIDVRFSAALRILAINNPRSFDMYYLVDLNPNNAKKLEAQIKAKFANKNAYVVTDDCNKKLIDLANFLKTPKGKDHKVLAFVDPYGMEVKWESIRALKSLPIDLWILVPTGLGVNRLLKNDGNISESWLKKLNVFLGIEESEIKKFFYKTVTTQTLFGDDTRIRKEENAIEKAGELYKKRLNEVFKKVSNPFLLKNSTGSVMYHLYMASNNSTAQKIANSIIKPKLM
jgi:three-Cys-motif partner protein